MIEVAQDLWTVEADVTCITTNGTVTSGGRNVMGAGCAKEAYERYPGVHVELGALLKAHGNHCYLLRPGLVSFPTKEDVSQPSTIERVLKSFIELDSLRALYGWEKIALPRPGCGLGGLSWRNEVRPMIEEELEFISEQLYDSLIIVGYPGGN
jgi:hypothetical protein